MRKSLRTALRVILLGGAGLVASQAKAQLKVGSNPTNIQKNAILELESKKQGLLLPRLDDFTGINGMGIPVKDGMLVYKMAAADGAEGLYIRQAGAWVLLASAADAASNWKLTGNDATATDFIGTKNTMPLTFKTDNKERFVITETGSLKAGTNAVIPTAANTVLDVLVLDPATGIVSQRKMNAAAFNKVVSTLNGLDGDLTFSLAGDGTVNNITTTATGTTLDLKVPIMNNASQAYGFLSVADWNKIQASQKEIVIGNFSTAVNANGLSIDQTGTQATLTLHPADGTHPGGVSTAAQEFGGAKTFLNPLTANNGVTVTAGGANVTGAATFNNAVTVTGATTLNGGATVTGNALFNDNVAVTGTTTVTGATTLNGGATVTGNAAFNNNVAVTGTTTLTGDATLNGKLIYPNAATSTTGTTVLLQGTGGEIVTRQLNDAAFDGSITTLNALTGPKIDLKAVNAGTDFNITTDATKTPMELNLNLPSASTLNTRGLVTNTDQNFGGVKKFADSLYAAKSMLVGDSAHSANSTLQVGLKGTGTVSMPIKTVSADAAVGDAYTVIVKSAATSPVTLSLPAAKDVEGRIINIKKVPVNAASDANTDNPVTILVVTGDNIEGGTSYVIINDWTFVTLQSDGDKGWYIIKK